MKIIRGRYLILGAALMGVVYTVVRSSRNNDTMPITFFSIDERLSEQTQEHIAAFIEQEQADSSEQLARGLQQTFPAIASVSIAHPASDNQEIELVSLTPLIRVNDDLVVCEDGPLLSSDLFQKQVIAKLPHLKVQNASVDQKACADTIRVLSKKLTSSFYDRFSITWHEDTKVLLQDKVKQDLCIVADVRAIPSEHCLGQCDEVYATMSERNKRKQAIIADVRFEKQIITYFQNVEGAV